MPGIDCDLIFSANYTQPIASLYLQDRDRDLLDGESNDPREPIQASRNPGRVTRASLNPVKATSDAKPRMYYSRLAGERAGGRAGAKLIGASLVPLTDRWSVAKHRQTKLADVNAPTRMRSGRSRITKRKNIRADNAYRSGSKANDVRAHLTSERRD